MDEAEHTLASVMKLDPAHAQGTVCSAMQRHDVSLPIPFFFFFFAFCNYNGFIYFWAGSNILPVLIIFFWNIVYFNFFLNLYYFIFICFAHIYMNMWTTGLLISAQIAYERGDYEACQQVFFSLSMSVANSYSMSIASSYPWGSCCCYFCALNMIFNFTSLVITTNKWYWIMTIYSSI